MLVNSWGRPQKKSEPVTPQCSLEVCISGDLVKLRYPKPDEYFQSSGGWPISNEPEGHLDNVAKAIASSGTRSRIACFSYKDHSLAKRLVCYWQTAEIVTLTGAESLTGMSPENIVSQAIQALPARVKDGYDAILIRHFLEHSKDPVGLLYQLSNLLNPRGVIYLEVPLIERFVERGIPLFLWEQHRVYFTAETMVKMLSTNFEHLIYNQIYGNDIEPSQCILMHKPMKEIRRVAIDTKLTASVRANTQLMLERICEATLEYIAEWRDFILRCDRNCALLGIGHTAHRFLQITDTSSLFGSLLDSDPQKIGLYLPGINIRISEATHRNIESMSVIVLGVHDRDTGRVSEKLKNQGYLGRVVSIYDYPGTHA